MVYAALILMQPYHSRRYTKPWGHFVISGTESLSSRKQPLVIIAAASADEARAERLKQALLDRGVRAVLSAEVGVAEKKARLFVLSSPAALKCQTLNNFLEDFTWSHGMRHIHIVGVETERPVLPMALRAERRSNGSFWTLPRPPVIGALYNDETSVEIIADEIAHECSSDAGITLARTVASSVAHRPLATGLATACALLLGVTVWQADQISAYQDEAAQAQAVLVHAQAQAPADGLPAPALGLSRAEVTDLEDVGVVPSFLEGGVRENKPHGFVQTKQPLLVFHDQVVSPLGNVVVRRFFLASELRFNRLSFFVD